MGQAVVSLTKPIPKLAFPVVRAIRKDVPRPNMLPISVEYRRHERPRFLRWNFKCCPMGLHPLSTVGAPIDPSGFPVKGCEMVHILQFVGWWDQQTDAQAAVDAVWGKQS